MTVLPDLWHLVDGEPDRYRGLPNGKIAVVAESSGYSFGQGLGLAFDLRFSHDEWSARIRL